MTKQTLIATRLALVVAAVATAAGCRTAQAARDDVSSAAGSVSTAVEAVFTDQGAEAVVGGSIADVDRRTRAVLRGMGMTLTDAEYDDNAREREYEARVGDRVAKVELEWRSATTTEVDVSVRVGATDYRKGEARDIISRIQAQR